MAGEHVIVIGATDSRIKAAVARGPVIEGKNMPMKASAPAAELLQAEQKRARNNLPPVSNVGAHSSSNEVLL